MDVNKVNLTSAEISALWQTYIQCSAENCFFKHFLVHLKDSEIKPIVEEALALNLAYIAEITEIFESEQFPIPIGFTDKDVDLSAPALFTDLFALSFVYRSGQVSIVNFSRLLGKVARLDVFDFFDHCLSTRKSLYKKSLKVMLSKGIYDRPPKMTYPQHAEFMDKEASLMKSMISENRPLNSFELSELFFAIERNAIGLILLIALIQVTRDKEVKEYLKKGKKLSEKQIDVYNKILKENEHFITFPVTLEATDSTISPFSEKLIMYLMSVTNGVGFTTLSDAMAVSIRKDVAAKYASFITDILKYGDEGMKILIDRGWMERPPQSVSRSDLLK